MENYQTVGVFVSVIGLFLGLCCDNIFWSTIGGGIMFVHTTFNHIDSERGCKIKPWNYSLLQWHTGYIWQHIPIDTGVYGLWIQEED